ncbi:F-box protein: endocytic membrane traffic, recycling ReCYcling 1 [Tulasnella sp. 425]|nr:F-box protein: endocytic membrane traffic, recycling ReCYcling 1 [Tulasnella sp. 425]
MDKWATLEPVRLHSTGGSPTGASSAKSPLAPSRLLARTSLLRPKIPSIPYLGPLPIDIHIQIISHLPITSVASYARVSRAAAALCRDEKIWEKHWVSLGVEKYGFEGVLDRLDREREERNKGNLAKSPATINVVEQDVIEDDDDFGAFATATTVPRASASNPFDFGGFVGVPPLESTGAPGSLTQVTGALDSSKSTFRERYRRAHTLLKPLLPALLSAPHVILTALFPQRVETDSASDTLRYQSQVLHMLSLFLSPALQPVLAWPSLLSALRAAIDRFDASLLTAFDEADRKGDESIMKDAAWASWEVFQGSSAGAASTARSLFGGGGGSEWEMGRTWAEKKEIFYEGDRWDPKANITENGTLDFRPMDDFMSHILDSIRTHGSAAVRVFPPSSGVLLAFADRVTVDVVGEYIIPLLSQARAVSNEVFLKATAATFAQAWRIVDLLLEVAAQGGGGPNETSVESPKPQEKSQPSDGKTAAAFLSRNQAEDVVFRMFEPNMDEYLDEEIESAKQAFETICKEWERQLSEATATPADARFLSSSNPAQVKRNVLASFTDVLLLPVTIVPRAMGAVAEGARTGASAAATGISMLNPQRWGGVGGLSSGGRAAPQPGYGVAGDDYSGGASIFELGDDEDDPDGAPPASKRSTLASINSTSTSTSRTSSPAPSTFSKSTSTKAFTFDRLQLLLSLDIALEIMHADRESLKRAETFQSYPGSYGHRVRETIEELFILMLQAMSERHIQPGFARAIEQMQTYKPSEHEETASVAPLMQFFELVHIADTMQSMVQVFFDKEISRHIDKTDFLNGVVREKKRFENSLDDSVAGGLNTGTDLLMKQVEHIILIKTGAREYYPMEGAPMELKPTTGCTEAIACLQRHCKLLKGSTSKDVLEVFYQEVGIRLNAIIQKHLKRQIISLEGGFQVIADLNAYHAFISSLKVPQITADFANLKMLGHVFIVEDAKDLAQIVRDVTRYGGSFRPEDVYEFIQRRSDWKKIEKTVDKTMYNLSFKEDCIIC